MHKFKAICWICLGSFFGSLNDVFTKILSAKFDSIEIASARFFFAIICLLPFVFKKPQILKTERIGIHFVRGLIFFMAITLWGRGLKSTYVSLAALISFSGPFFLMFMSRFFLNEKITIYRFFATIISFITILGVIDFKNVTFSIGCVYFLIGEIFFALSDVINKKHSTTENHITMLFYYSLFALFISIIPTYIVFVQPNFKDILLMFFQGASSNMFLFCLLRAFSLADATFLSPFKYLEFLFSVLFGYFIFKDIPTKYSFFVMLVIVVCNLWLIYCENKKNITTKNNLRGVA